MSATFNPEINEIRRRLDDQTREIAELRGSMQQLDKLATLANRQTTLQIAAIVITLCLTIAGGLYFQTNSINQRIGPVEKRIDTLEGRMIGLEARVSNLEARMERLEQRMDRLEQRMERLEQTLDEIKQLLRARK